MNTTVEVDDSLLRLAQEMGKHETQQDAVRAALHEYVERRRRADVLELAGTIVYDDDYDYKAPRRRE